MHKLETVPTSIRCRVATRVRGERGGTIGVLDRRAGEKKGKSERDAHARMHKGAHGKAARQRRRHKWSRRQSKRTRVYVYEYGYADEPNGYNRSGRRNRCRCLYTYAHRGHDGGTVGSTRAFHGAARASRRPAEGKLWRTTEEKRSVTVRQHFVLANARSPSLTVSLSFIDQGGRPFTSH